MRLLHYNSGSSTWEPVAMAVTPQTGTLTDREVSFTGVSDFSPFTLKNADAIILPLNTITLNAERTTDKSVLVKWTTNGEKNVRMHQVEYSSGGTTYEVVATVAAENKAIAQYQIRAKSYSQLKYAPVDGRKNVYEIIIVVMSNSKTT